MEERRKSKRTLLSTNVIINKLPNNGKKSIEIEVQDLSKSGLGFVCDTKLEIGEVYEAYLTIWTKEVIHAFLRIVRIELLQDKNEYLYGASFVGMPELDASRIGVYQTINENEN